LDVVNTGLAPILLKGAFFTKHGLQGVTRRFIRCTPSHIYWLKDGESDLAECVDPITWDSVTEVRQGKQTLMFSRARAADVPDQLCLSLIYRGEQLSLDLVADTPDQAFEWYDALSGYLAELQEARDKAAAKALADKESELQAVKRRLAEETQAHQAEKSAAMADLEDAQKQLQARRKSLDASAAQMESAMVKVSEERDQLVATVEELSKRVKELREKLDDQLSRNSDVLEEIREVQGAKLEAKEAKNEMDKERAEGEAMARQMEELVQMLMIGIGPSFVTLEKNMQDDLAAIDKVLGS